MTKRCTPSYVPTVSGISVVTVGGQAWHSRTDFQGADRLAISESTAKSHVLHIRRKLGVTSRTQAVARGRELGTLP